MNQLKVVAFDCDGVLFDSKRANIAYYNHLLNYFEKMSMTAQQIAYIHMHTLDESLAYLFDDIHLIDRVKAYRKTMSYSPFLRFMEIEPYLKPLLKILRPAYKTAIATNRTDTMKRVLSEHGLEKSFDLVVTALDVKRPKPYPDQLFKLLDFFDCKPRQVLYVGDSDLDQKAAEAAGVSFVAYQNNSISADYHIKSLKEIEQFLNP
jgi:HAD superfamily hydrolase (TIGR01549 family)